MIKNVSKVDLLDTKAVVRMRHSIVNLRQFGDIHLLQICDIKEILIEGTLDLELLTHLLS